MAPSVFNTELRSCPLPFIFVVTPRTHFRHRIFSCFKPCKLVEHRRNHQNHWLCPFRHFKSKNQLNDYWATTGSCACLLSPFSAEEEKCCFGTHCSSWIDWYPHHYSGMFRSQATGVLTIYAALSENATIAQINCRVYGVALPCRKMLPYVFSFPVP